MKDESLGRKKKMEAQDRNALKRQLRREQELLELEILELREELEPETEDEED